MKYLSLTIPGGQTVQPPSSVPSGGLSLIQGILQNAMTIFITLSVIICIVVIAYSGFQWASSGGDKNKVAKARARLTWAVIGLIIVLGALFIVSIVGTIFNIQIF